MDTAHIDGLLTSGAISAVLLSHYDFGHLGGLPVIHKHYHSTGSLPIILGTTPIMHLGRQALLDGRLSYKDRFGTDYPPCLEHVEAAVDTIRPLRYSQPVPLPPHPDHDPLDVVTVMAMPAGHSLGGALWRIRRHTASEDILYAVDFDHKRGVCLDGAAFDLLVRPTCLITDCRQALQVAEPRRDRDAAFLGYLRTFLVKNNVVLVPIECASVDAIWMFERWCDTELDGKVQVHLLTSASATRTIDYFKGMLEWMGPAMMRHFDQRRDNPFDLKHVRLTSHLADLHGTAGPKLILASGPDLHCGLSLQVFLYYAASTHFHVLFMDEPRVGSVGGELVQLQGGEMTVVVNESQPLTGNDLILFKKEQRARREQLDAEAAIAKHKNRAIDGLGSDGSDDSDSDGGGAGEDQLEQQAELLKDLYWSDYKTDCWLSASSSASARGNTIYGDPSRLPNYTQPQFCFKDHHTVHTDYGQTVPTEWLHSQQQQQQDLVDLVEQARNLIKRRVVNPNTLEDLTAEPVKWVPVKRKVVVKCHKRVFSGFCGLSDGKSLRNIIGQLAPRRLILVGGSPSATDYLYNHYLYAASVHGLSQVMAPATGECVELTMSTASMPAALDESLTETMSVLRRDAYQVGHLLARLHLNAGNVVLSALEGKQPKTPVMIGEIKLGDFRRALLHHSPLASALFERGDLVITSGGEQVVLRKSDEAAWCLEGAPSVLFERVKELFYAQLAII